MVVRQRPIESITTEGASPSSTTRFTAVVRRCSSVLWSSNRPSIFIGLNISNTYASVDYPSDAAVVCKFDDHSPTLVGLRSDLTRGAEFDMICDRRINWVVVVDHAKGQRSDRLPRVGLRDGDGHVTV